MCASIRTLCFPAAVLATVFFAVTPTRAGVIFSNFGTGNNAYSAADWTVSGATSQLGQQNSSAMQFTSGTAFILTQIDVALGWISGFNGVTLSLETSVGALPSNVVLASWTLTGLPTLDSTFSTRETVTASLNLTAGQYWIVAAAMGSDTWAGWNENNIGQIGDFAQTQNNVNWTLFPAARGFNPGAFDVLSTPEPATALLAASALGLLTVLRQKQRRRSRSKCKV
jgi:MYXO-CTERM domain-containing protein